jgi:hypothetical protein
MRRLLALILLWAGLLGAGSPALACASAAAAGDCCPAGAPSGCRQVYEQLDLAATAYSLTRSTPSAVVSAERSRGPQLLENDCGSPDPVVIAGAVVAFAHNAPPSIFDAPIVHSAATDRSLTYLHTGRLRL